MSGCDTPIHAWLIAGWAAAVLVALAVTHWRLRGVLRPSYAWGLVGLRGVALALLLVLLLQPYREDRRPDRSRFQVALLADCSASMTSRDCRGDVSRLDVLRQELQADRPDSALGRLRRTYRVRPFLFSEELRPWAAQTPAVLPGKTAVGDALRECLQEAAVAPLGAVLLLSDGHSNTGAVPTEVAKAFRQRGIPVSCVGIGEAAAAGDLQVVFPPGTLTARKAEAFTLPVRLRSTLSAPVDATVELADDQGVLERREVHIEPGREVRADFRVTPTRAGLRTYAARVPSVAGDTRRETDVDYAAVRVTEPDTFKVLALWAHLGWEYRFLKTVADSGEQLAWAGVVRTGPESYYTVGLPERPQAGFPDGEAVLNGFDVVVLDARAAALLSEVGRTNLARFVADRGGGLLVVGPLSAVPEPLAKLLPALPAAGGAGQARQALEVVPGVVFPQDATGILTAPPGPFLPAGDLAWVPSAIKKGARPALVLRASPDTPILAVQSYGSGRTACLAAESTWRWRLESRSGQDLHDRFWRSLLVWLGSTTKQRVVARCAGQKVGLGDEVHVAVDVLGSDFLPAADARVNATVTAPSGASRVLLLNALGEAPGRYDELVIPEEAGEYRVAFRVETGTDTVEHETRFLARPTGQETQDTAYREGVLRDVARITQGGFRHYAERDPGSLPVSAGVPYRVERLYWADSWGVLAALLAVLCLDWYARRRVGLR